MEDSSVHSVGAAPEKEGGGGGDAEKGRFAINIFSKKGEVEGKITSFPFALLHAHVHGARIALFQENDEGAEDRALLSLLLHSRVRERV